MSSHELQTSSFLAKLLKSHDKNWRQNTSPSSGTSNPPSPSQQQTEQHSPPHESGKEKQVELASNQHGQSGTSKKAERSQQQQQQDMPRSSQPQHDKNLVSGPPQQVQQKASQPQQTTSSERTTEKKQQSQQQSQFERPPTKEQLSQQQQQQQQSERKTEKEQTQQLQQSEKQRDSIEVATETKEQPQQAQQGVQQKSESTMSKEQRSKLPQQTKSSEHSIQKDVQLQQSEKTDLPKTTSQKEQHTQASEQAIEKEQQTQSKQATQKNQGSVTGQKKPALTGIPIDVPQKNPCSYSVSPKQPTGNISTSSRYAKERTNESTMSRPRYFKNKSLILTSNASNNSRQHSNDTAAKKRELDYDLSEYQRRYQDDTTKYHQRHEQQYGSTNHQRQEDDQSDSYKRRLFVSNLLHGTTREDLVEHFKPYGKIVDAVKRPDRLFGFVEYEDVTMSNLAIDMLDGQRFKDRVIHVEYTQPRPNYTSSKKVFDNDSSAVPLPAVFSRLQPSKQRELNAYDTLSENHDTDNHHRTSKTTTAQSQSQTSISSHDRANDDPSTKRSTTSRQSTLKESDHYDTSSSNSKRRQTESELESNASSSNNKKQPQDHIYLGRRDHDTYIPDYDRRSSRSPDRRSYRSHRDSSRSSSRHDTSSERRRADKYRASTSDRQKSPVKQRYSSTTTTTTSSSDLGKRHASTSTQNTELTFKKSRHVDDDKQPQPQVKTTISAVTDDKQKTATRDSNSGGKDVTSGDSSPKASVSNSDPKEGATISDPRIVAKTRAASTNTKDEQDQQKPTSFIGQHQKLQPQQLSSSNVNETPIILIISTSSTITSKTIYMMEDFFANSLPKVKCRTMLFTSGSRDDILKQVNMEGVQALILLENGFETSGTVFLQVYERHLGAKESLHFNEYENIDIGNAASLIQQQIITTNHSVSPSAQPAAPVSFLNRTSSPVVKPDPGAYVPDPINDQHQQMAMDLLRRLQNRNGPLTPTGSAASSMSPTQSSQSLLPPSTDTVLPHQPLPGSVPETGPGLLSRVLKYLKNTEKPRYSKADYDGRLSLIKQTITKLEAIRYQLTAEQENVVIRNLMAHWNQVESEDPLPPSQLYQWQQGPSSSSSSPSNPYGFL